MPQGLGVLLAVATIDAALEANERMMPETHSLTAAAVRERGCPFCTPIVGIEDYAGCYVASVSAVRRGSPPRPSSSP